MQILVYAKCLLFTTRAFRLHHGRAEVPSDLIERMSWSRVRMEFLLIVRRTTNVHFYYQSRAERENYRWRRWNNPARVS